ncbi:hypothetical protein AGOR_G00196470 [Albula goreensis]|uniref:B30.2/SPRY domain-containing protein n=1 Tax=Albula goreensis TaxID=1534307 RepID=A0A8T3CVK8_9TELE|nr:hypothetical protein AGOR_G00196470 [Albula goreensis]
MAATPESTAPVPPDPVCSRHGDPLCWYRLEDEQLVCESCKASSQEGHRFWTVTHAFEARKTVLEITLQTLREKLGGSRKAHGLFVEMAHHTKTQVQQTERLIKDEFEKLQKFLQEEKESRLAALKREEGQKSQKLMQMIKEMTKEISSLSHTIKAIEKHLESEDISFLQNYKSTIEKIHGVKTRGKKPGQIHNDVVEKFCKATKEKEPEVPTGALIDVAKHLGNLKYSVWEKMLGVVNYTLVTLDPNTASRCLSLSEDLTSLSYSPINPPPPDNPERFASAAEILGSEGFSSGRRSWDVEVGANTDWAVGVVRESTNRKKRTKLSSAEGILALRFSNDTYTVDTTQLSIWRKPQKVRVEVDWSTGRMTFSDAAFNSHILSTIELTFKEKVFPYFYSFCEERPLQIAPETRSIAEGAH